MGILFRPDENCQSWEGQQAVATFNPYKADGRWYAFYDGRNYTPKGFWPIGMATAPTLSGPRVRMSEKYNPVSIAEVFAENPQETDCFMKSLKESNF